MIVRFSAEADMDLLLIENWIAEDNSEEIAQRVVGRLVSATKQIGRFPRCGRPTTAENVRQLIVAPYILTYRIDPGLEQVTILTVRHTAQN